MQGFSASGLYFDAIGCLSVQSKLTQLLGSLTDKKLLWATAE